MKALVAVLVLVTSGTWVCQEVFAQNVGTTPAAGSTNQVSSGRTNAVVRGLRKRTVAATQGTNAVPNVPNATTNLSPLLTPNVFAANGQLQPGLYQSAPYSCIVIAPGPHPDDKCIIGRNNTADKMPMVQPELRMKSLRPDVYFIPRDPR